MRLLIADSNEIVLESYARHFSKVGMTVATSPNGIDCVTTLRSFRPDLLVIEIDLPWSGAAGVLARMHEEHGLPKVPVIVMAWAFSNSIDTQQLLHFPLEDFVCKPCSSRHLVQRIKRISSDPTSIRTASQISV